MDLLRDYLTNLQTKLATGNSLEHTHRSSFESLIHKLNEEIIVLNEPKRSEHGNPDFVFLNKKNRDILLGYVETKDIDKNLNEVEKSEQLRRYLGYSNLILTNYIEFRFFRNGEKYQTIEIAKLHHNLLEYKEENFYFLESELKAFLEGKPERITNATRLAKIMGGRASRIRDNVRTYLNTQDNRNEELQRVYEVMKQLLVHDLSVEKFSDMYAQTLVYGLFVARFYDSTGESFTRQKARDLVPPSNPFLQHFFDHIVGPKFDKRLAYIVDDLCEIFTVADVREIIHRHFNLFGEYTEKDPIIHFYEDFLKEYDPDLRKQMGAYYTPVPVVDFMVRAVDEVLKRDFNLPEGLANTEKINIKKVTQGDKAKEQVHKVQLLDPAVGTATFLNEAIKFIHKRFKNQQGMWESYVNHNLLPRLHGFELMMAPYTIAHLKLAMTLKETGVNTITNRLGVYLTNTLEEGVKQENSLFSMLGLAEAISKEAEEAGKVKNEKPIMVILGNPPYSVSSQNKGKWIVEQMEVYKKDLNERKINLDDDYIKFIRFAETCIERTGYGIVAMITNNSFIDGVTHRQMRSHLLETFDYIYIIDLHGNSKKKEVSPDGGKDENVFDIMQGVSINIFVKKEKRAKKHAEIYHLDLYGKRKEKFSYLNKLDIQSAKWNRFKTHEPYYFFVPKDFGLQEEYDRGFSVNEIFIIKNSGFRSGADDSQVTFTKEAIERVVTDLCELPEHDFREKYSLKDGRNHNYAGMRQDVKNGLEPDRVIETLYRPFDIRWTYYSYKSSGFVARPRNQTMNNFVGKKNIGLIYKRGYTEELAAPVGITNLVSHERTWTRAGMQGADSVAPLYLYHVDGTKTENLKPEILFNIKQSVGVCTAEDVLDYIYAVLHSRKYCLRYKEFLRIDFPRVPYPKSPTTFHALSQLGKELRFLHLLESPELQNTTVQFPQSGSNIVEKLEFADGKVYINQTQYFGGITTEEFNFYIGGYQPAQKWLKDRKGFELKYEDILHYQKIIKAISKTFEVVKNIDSVIEI